MALAIALILFSLAGVAQSATPRRHAGGRAPKVSLAVRVAPAASERVLATGKVSPAPGHGSASLQVRSGRTWRQLAHGGLRNGAFRLRAKVPGEAARASLRVLITEGSRRLGASLVRSVRIVRRVHAPLGPATAPSSSPSAPSPASPAESSSPVPPGDDEAPLPPLPDESLSAASLMSTVESYGALPNHLSGTPSSTAALDEFQANMAAAGLQLGEQAFTFPRFAPTAVGLTADGTAVPSTAIAPLLYSGTTGPSGVTAPLLYGGSSQSLEGGTPGFTASEAKDKIVVVTVPYKTNSKAVGFNPAIETAVEGGALGFVAVTQAVADYPKWEDVNARNGTGPLPVVTVGKRSGLAVIAAAEAGKEGTLTLAADTSGVSCDRDVWGVLEGADPSRRVFVGVPATSYTPSASEHGTGVAITVGLARHYAALPKSERPETLVFMALGGHEIGWLGLQALLASPQGPWFQEADGYVHLGSGLGAPTSVENADGTITVTPTPDPTGRLHESENPLLEGSIIEDFAAAGVPTGETPPHIASGGEQTNAYAAGIPTASFSGANLWFHTAGDVASTVEPTILAKDADAFRRSVDTITAIPPGLLRAENAHAAQLGSEIDAPSRGPVSPTLGAGGKLGTGGVGGPPATAVAHCP